MRRRLIAPALLLALLLGLASARPADMATVLIAVAESDGTHIHTPDHLGVVQDYLVSFDAPTGRNLVTVDTLDQATFLAAEPGSYIPPADAALDTTPPAIEFGSNLAARGDSPAMAKGARIIDSTGAVINDSVGLLAAGKAILHGYLQTDFTPPSAGGFAPPASQNGGAETTFTLTRPATMMLLSATCGDTDTIAGSTLLQTAWFIWGSSGGWAGPYIRWPAAWRGNFPVEQRVVQRLLAGTYSIRLWAKPEAFPAAAGTVQSGSTVSSWDLLQVGQ